MKKKHDSINQIIFPPSIYNFLKIADEQGVDKTVLDCGAGGRRPPLALFYIHGYKTFGIDISETQIALANDFAARNEIELTIRKADMRRIPFDDEVFGCVFSWNSSIHLTKNDTRIAIGEMLRVLKRGGLLYVNFLWNKGIDMNLGEERNPGEFWRENSIVHSCFSEDEVDQFFEGCDILYKQKKEFMLRRNNRTRNEAYMDYIVKK